jgi:hypothetical protein
LSSGGKVVAGEGTAVISIRHEKKAPAVRPSIMRGY